ncbi:NAD(P)H-binding protein [Microbacterium horticulturae]|uniref:NAD(P)H-binding protein n=1 Tax=Microbacterium horticulturae TaxID=3028316 RepID=A0ABY8BXC2_9MICO|nr:NAD(P)H-binding protein [Microbacterium sp. KACC 23027]WEG08819.1 NAD(P)H-binding protein [Microbacterium sp. KACC 23027]
MIVVTTPTGQIGSRLVRLLLDRGEEVRVIVRDASRLAAGVRRQVEVIEGSHNDPEVLDRALHGADALFFVVPPNPNAPSALEHYLDFGRAGAAAVARHGVGHVVGVSTAGHGWSKPAGTLSAAFAMDAELAASGSAYRALSMPFYMDNLLGQVGAIQHGVLSLTCAPEQPLASIATRDIAAAAADLLVDLSWKGQANVPLFGPDITTPDEMAEIIGDEVGRPVVYQQMAMTDLAQMMQAQGASEQAVRDVTEMFAAQDDGINDEDWPKAQLAPTDFRTWCREVLAPAMRDAAA